MNIADPEEFIKWKSNIDIDCVEKIMGFTEQYVIGTVKLEV